jgi:hypothetical protein
MRKGHMRAVYSPVSGTYHSRKPAFVRPHRYTGARAYRGLSRGITRSSPPIL